jgi:hypothetical protein
VRGAYSRTIDDWFSVFGFRFSVFGPPLSGRHTAD